MKIHPKDKAWAKRIAARLAMPYLPKTPRVIMGIVEDGQAIRDAAVGTAVLVHPESVEEYEEAILGSAENVGHALTFGQRLWRVMNRG